ncbi:MAG: hypothetical protein IPM57_04040 [Oligoflexia bacterium]|nr:hypothetical protein [Oligoflexia bacterium]
MKQVRRSFLGSPFLFALTFVFLLLGVELSAKVVVVDETDEIVVNPGKSRSAFKEAKDGVEMRKNRRFGVGLQAAGALGFGGAIMDLNFTPQWSFGAGFGGGEGFQTFKLEGRYVLTGDWLMPYFAFGYANWTSIGKADRISRTNPSYLGEKLLTETEKNEGEYKKHLIYPSFGLQFMQLTGEWAGFSLLAEFTALIDLGGFVAAPTGTLSALYYF